MLSIRAYNPLRLSIVLLGFLAALALPLFAVRAEENEVGGGDAFLEGRRLQQSGEWAASIERFRAAAEVYSLVPDYALYQMAQSAFQEGDMELAASSLEKLLSLYPNTPVRRTARLELASLYYETGRPARAAPLIEAALPGAESSREVVGLMLMLAKACAESNNLSKSDSICWQLIHGWPSKPEALEAAELVHEVGTLQRRLAIAKVYLQNKKSRKALATLDEMLGDPAAAALMPELLLYKAQSLAMEGQKQVAVDLYDKIIADHIESSSAAVALLNRAEYKRQLGPIDEALADYARVVELFPGGDAAPQALRGRAKIFESLDDPREYVEYGKILEKYPRSALTFPTTMYWGVKLFRAGDYAGAREVFEKLLAANLGSDANADAAFWLAKCQVAEGRTDSAKIQLAGIIGRFEESYQAFRARAMLRSLSGVESIYSPYRIGEWQDLFAFDREPFVSLEADTPEAAFTSVENQLAYWNRQTLERLKFLMLNRLSEAEWELEHISSEASDVDARYALAWALFQWQSYNKSVRLASSLRGKFSEAPRATRAQYVLYPPAYPGLVGTTSSKYDIDPALSLAVMREESHFREDAISTSDARGLMQILPSTGEWLAGKVFGPAAFDRSALFLPSVNIELGNYYLRYLLDKFDNNMVLAIAAYNWGETNLRRWMSKSPPGDFDVFVESIPADETRRYVKKVLRSYVVYQSLYPPDYLSGGGM